MSITYRNEKGSKITKDEFDDNFRWLNEAGEKTSSTLTFDRKSNIHGTLASPLTGTLDIDLTSSVLNGGVVVYWSGSSNPTFTGDATPVFNNSITQAGTYRIILIHLDGTDVIGTVFNAGGEASTGNPPEAPSLAVTEYEFTVGVAPEAPSLVVTEYEF